MTPLHRQVADLFFPLTDFYSTRDGNLPRLKEIPGEAMPQPYRELLVHDRDMTSTLEAYLGSSLRVRVLEKHVEDSRLTRQVVLVTDPGSTVAEFGAIRINLDQFATAAREEILSCEQPLGTILLRHRIPFTCRPNAYFSFRGDEIARHAFDLHEAHTLYGRHNLLTTTEEKPLAEVVEILPPLPATGESA